MLSFDCSVSYCKVIKLMLTKRMTYRKGQPHGYGKLYAGGLLLFEGLFWDGNVVRPRDGNVPGKVHTMYEQLYYRHNTVLLAKSGGAGAADGRHRFLQKEIRAWVDPLELFDVNAISAPAVPE